MLLSSSVEVYPIITFWPDAIEFNKLLFTVLKSVLYPTNLAVGLPSLSVASCKSWKVTEVLFESVTTDSVNVFSISTKPLSPGPNEATLLSFSVLYVCWEPTFINVDCIKTSRGVLSNSSLSTVCMWALIIAFLSGAIVTSALLLSFNW